MNTYLKFKIIGIQKTCQFKSDLELLARSLDKNTISQYEYQSMYLKDKTTLETALLKLDENEFIQLNIRKENREGRLYAGINGTNTVNQAEIIQNFIMNHYKPERLKMEISYRYL